MLNLFLSVNVLKKFQKIKKKSKILIIDKNVNLKKGWWYKYHKKNLNCIEFLKFTENNNSK